MNLISSPFGLGEKLILELLNRGESVHTIFPSPKDVPMSFLGKINLKYSFVRFDQEFHLDKVLPKKVSTLYHLYDVYTGALPYLFRSNTLATLLLLDWAKNASVSNLVYLSSGEIYGQGQGVTEKDGFNPRSFYATTKFEAEILLRFYKSFDIKTVRIFFPFGKNLKQGHISNLAQLVMTGDSIETEYNTIGPTFIDDAVEPLLKMREIKGSQIYNISGSPCRVETLVDEIKAILSKSPKKVNVGKLELFGDSSKAKGTLGYKETPIQEALKAAFGK